MQANTVSPLGYKLLFKQPNNSKINRISKITYTLIPHYVPYPNAANYTVEYLLYKSLGNGFCCTKSRCLPNRLVQIT